jgi:CO/xanthine dehydrogenase Mo-binding subunit
MRLAPRGERTLDPDALGVRARQPDALANRIQLEDWLMGDFGIGAAVRRKEDFRFLTGQGTYTDDIARPGQLHAFLLQSPRSRGARCHFNNRLVSNPMEPRAATGEFDRGSGEYTLYTTSQAPHVHRLLIAAFVLQLPEHKLRVVAPDWAVASAQRARSMPSRRRALACGKARPPGQMDGGAQRDLPHR